MHRYKLEHEDLPIMQLETPLDRITGTVDERLGMISHTITQLEGFRRECWRFIDRQKNAELIKPYVKEIERLTEEYEKLNDEHERILKNMDGI